MDVTTFPAPSSVYPANETFAPSRGAARAGGLLPTEGVASCPRGGRSAGGPPADAFAPAAALTVPPRPQHQEGAPRRHVNRTDARSGRLLAAGIYGLLLTAGGAAATRRKDDWRQTGSSVLPDYAQVGLPSVPLRGCPAALYSLSLRVGEQTLSALFDTGSADLVLPAEDAAGWGPDTDDAYVPGASATSLGFADFSLYGAGGVYGHFYLDDVSVASFARPLRMALMRAETWGFGRRLTSCHFYNESVAGPMGVLGLSPKMRSEMVARGFSEVGDSSFVGALARRGDSSVLAVQLCDAGGLAWIGGFDPRHAAAAPVFVDMSGYGGMYSVVVIDVLLGDDQLLPDTPPIHGVIDTGNPTISVSASGKEIFDRGLATALATFPHIRRAAPDCYAGLPDDRDEIDRVLPELSLRLSTNVTLRENVTLSLPATRSYLVPYPSPEAPTMWCSRVEGSGSPTIGLIGATLMRSAVVILDSEKGRIGFAPQRFSRCPSDEPSPRPPPPEPHGAGPGASPPPWTVGRWGTALALAGPTAACFGMAATAVVHLLRARGLLGRDDVSLEMTHPILP